MRVRDPTGVHGGKSAGTWGTSLENSGEVSAGGILIALGLVGTCFTKQAAKSEGDQPVS